MMMVIPQHPLNGWEPIVTQVIGHRLLDIWEATAMRATTWWRAGFAVAA